MQSTSKAFQFLTNRRVLRTVGIYLATVLVILRLADRLSEMFGISDLVQPVLAVVLLAGLPLAIRLAWRASPVVGLSEGDAEAAPDSMERIPAIRNPIRTRWARRSGWGKSKFVASWPHIPSSSRRGSPFSPAGTLSIAR